MEFIDQPSGGSVNRVERDDDQQRKEEYRLPDVPQDVMSHFMPHHKEQFVFVEFRDDRVPQDYALGGAEAGDVGVESFRIFALRDLVNAAAFDPGSLGELKNLRLKLLVLHRTEFVEERLNQDGRDQDRENEEGNRQQPGVKPPPARTLFEQQIGNPQEQKSDDDRDQQPCDLVAEPFAERLVRQIVSVLAHKALVVAQRKIDYEVDDQKDGEIEADDKEPPSADALRPIANARGESREQEQRGDQQPPDDGHDPQDDTAAVIRQRLFARFGNRDRGGG